MVDASFFRQRHDEFVKIGLRQRRNKIDTGLLECTDNFTSDLRLHALTYPVWIARLSGLSTMPYCAKAFAVKCRLRKS